VVDIVPAVYELLSIPHPKVVNGHEHPIRIGDAYRLEPKDTHDIINNTDQPLKAVFIKSTYDPKDKVKVED